MKTLKLISAFLLLMTLSVVNTFAQTGPPAPSSGTWAIIDTNYQVGTSAQGFTTARLSLQNTTMTLTTGVQFRVFYDKIAFTNATVSLLGSPTNLDLQYTTNTANGYITVSLVYTGSSSSYTLANGERFEITFTHAPAATFNTLAAISNLTWSGVQTYQPYAAKQDGTDLTLSLHNYGGIFLSQQFAYHGTFNNVSGTPAKNLTLALQKKPSTSGSWAQHATYTTDNNGHFSILENIDTTYWDVRLAIQGDTMGVGNVISTTDAQQINQWVLENGTMTGFDYYAADVNGSNGVTIADAYGVFGRISGRFSQWPNGVKDVKFFTSAEYTTINGSATNYTSSISGTTNFTFDILPGQPDSVTFYVLVPGDANQTGYHMARLTPIDIINPANAQNYLIDETVEYDFPTSSVEVNVPSLSVNEGNLVQLPVKVYTNGKQVGAVQLALQYDSELLEFRELYNTGKAMSWLTFINPTDGVIEWGGYDNSNNENLLNDGEDLFTLNFIAKKPQGEWGKSPLYTTRKFVGSSTSNDMTVTPTNGVVEVKMMGPGIVLGENEILVFPNPTTGEVIVQFNIPQAGKSNLSFVNTNGEKVITLFDGYISTGNYSYTANLKDLSAGTYYTTLINNDKVSVNKTVLIK